MTATLLEELARTEAGAAESAGVAGELAAIRSRFEEAIGKLGAARVQALPWYVCIGAPGSGKTTALVNSGLHFLLPAAERNAPVAGIGGTRNCDWWFTEEAVLLDTAGRYTTQQSNARADAAAWHGFLALLKQFRPQRPLSGALVAASVTDLMLWTKLERARFAAHVRMRLAELYAALGARFPVYLLATKTDLLAGFTEFFDELDASERAQVWGTTFDSEPDPANLEARYAQEFAALEARLNAEMLARLHEERDLLRRAAIYRFPQQFHALGPPLGELLAQAFTTQIDHRAPLLRGVYFTSGTQEGNPIDRVLGTLARTFGLERAAAVRRGATGRSYFIAGLLREVVLAEAGVAAALA
ncbi:MAG: type VI secretion system membrane subunit TssM [Betaproteobacteria bacterium]|nr:type VI secretion system membrane subunit TssM [Betaproteobacteria bacterium]